MPMRQRHSRGRKPTSRFVRGWGLSLSTVEVDCAKDGIRSAGPSLSNRSYYYHYYLSQLYPRAHPILSPPSFPPQFPNTSRPSIGRLAPKRELLEPRGSLRICTWAKSQPAKFLRKQIQSKSTA